MKGCIWLLVVFCLLTSLRGAIDPASVIILVNDSDDESIDLGYYYALKREVPIENIVHLPLPAEESISWDQYLEFLYNPLIKRMIETDWFEGFTSDREDSLGRKVSVVNDHKVGAMVVCKGVPLAVKNDPERLPSLEVYSEDRKLFYTNRASVDSELALLPLPKANIDGFFPNPLFRRTESRNLFDVDPLVIGRLDGPSYELAKAMIDNAIRAETEGIAGRAYVDISGPHESGDVWLEELSKTLDEKGFELDVHEERGRFNRIDRFDEPLLYFGWYSGSVDGPFTNYNFSFPTGAIALHIHSFSASTVRDPRKGWVGPLVTRGVTATFGNTSEPFLYLTHQPHLIMEALFKGLSMGQAALYAHPGLSWAGAFFGDPLYQPPIELMVSSKNEYDVIRMANVALSAGNETAFKAVLAEHNQGHHFATGLWLFDYYYGQGNQEMAYEHLSSSRRPAADAPTQWGVLVTIAEALFKLEKKKEALEILDELLVHMKLSKEAQGLLLDRALKFATIYDLPEEEQIWRSKLEALRPPATK